MQKVKRLFFGGRYGKVLQSEVIMSEKYKLYNIDGIRLLYKRTKYNKGFALNLGVVQGSQGERQDGITHFMEHMFFNGTKSLTQEELAKKIREKVPHINASTARTACFIDAGNSVRRIEETFDLCSDMLLNSSFEEDKIEREKGVIIEEIRRNENNNDYLAAKALRLSFYDYPEYKKWGTGSVESVSETTREMLLENRDRIILRDNILVSFAGNVSLSKVKKLIRKYLVANVPNKPAEKLEDLLDSVLNGKPSLQVITKESKKITLMIGVKQNFGMADRYKNFMWALYSAIMNQMSGRLFVKLRSENSLVYAYSYSRESWRKQGYQKFRLHTGREKLRRCIEVIAETVQDIKKNGITREEFEDIITNVKVDRDISFKQNGRIVDEMLNFYLNHNGVRKPSELLEYEKRVTYEEINEFIKQNATNEFVSVVVVGDATKDDIQSIDEIQNMFK